MAGPGFDGMAFSPPWRQAGRSTIDCMALVQPLDASDHAVVPPGVRLWRRDTPGAAADARAILAQEPLDSAPRAALLDHFIALSPQGDFVATDRVRLADAQCDADDWHFAFRIRRFESPNLEPAPGRLCLLLAVQPDGERPRRMSFAFVASRIAVGGDESPLAGFAVASLGLRLV